MEWCTVGLSRTSAGLGGADKAQKGMDSKMGISVREFPDIGWKSLTVTSGTGYGQTWGEMKQDIKAQYIHTKVKLHLVRFIFGENNTK